MKILVAFNNRCKSSRKALELAKVHARAFKGEVLLATSADATISQKDVPSKEDAEKALSEAVQEFEEESIPCSSHLLIRGYSPGEDIVLFASENQIDEILVGIEKKSKVGKLLLGSLAQHVILKARCPVLAVKATEGDPDVFLGSTSMDV